MIVASEEFKAQAKAAVAGGFKQNQSLGRIVYKAARDSGHSWRQARRMKRTVDSLDDMQRYMVEHRITQMAVADHVPFPANSIRDGVYTGDWMYATDEFGNPLIDILEWFLEAWPRIFAIIEQILNLFNRSFSMLTVVLVLLAVGLIGSFVTINFS